MDQKPLHLYMFEMLDFAERLYIKVVPVNKDESPDMMNIYYKNASYFMGLINIESMIDTFGRDLVAESARNSGIPVDEIIPELTRRMDALRAHIRELSEEFDFNETIDSRSESLKTWKKRI